MVLKAAQVEKFLELDHEGLDCSPDSFTDHLSCRVECSYSVEYTHNKPLEKNGQMIVMQTNPWEMEMETKALWKDGQIHSLSREMHIKKKRIKFLNSMSSKKIK